MTVISDLFDRANSTTSLGSADTGQLWVPQLWAPVNGPTPQLTSRWGINGNAAYSPSAAEEQIATIDHGTADGSVDINVSTLQAGTGAGLTLRWASATALWTAFLARNGGNTETRFFLRKYTSATTSVDRVNQGIANANVPHSIHVDMSGTQMDLFVDGNFISSPTDSFNSTATRHGIQMYFSALNRLDNYSATVAVGGGLMVGACQIGG